jgi:hypothetical protein
MAINMKHNSNSQAPATGSSVPSFGKTGSSAMAELEKVEKETALAAEQNKRMWRFFLKEGEEGRITFIDGVLTPEGSIDFFTYYEHNLMLQGKWGNTFVCTKDNEPCPICATGDKPSFVGVFTVIDHREFVSKKDNKVYKNTPRLFVAKRETLKMLNMLGAKRGGLAGCTFDVARTGDKSASVGSMFDFIEKTPVEELQKLYTRKNAEGISETYFVPADYVHEAGYKTAEELRNEVPALEMAAPMGSVSKADAAALNNEL